MAYRVRLSGEGRGRKSLGQAHKAAQGRGDAEAPGQAARQEGRQRMSDEPTADLGLIARQQRMILADLGTLRDDVSVLTAIAMRQDATLTALAARLHIPGFR
jgi:hypothetical protein